MFDFKRNLMMKVNKSLKAASKQNCSKGKKNGLQHAQLKYMSILQCLVLFEVLCNRAFDY